MGEYINDRIDKYINIQINKQIKKFKKYNLVNIEIN